jgi:hypothetical protein
MESGECLHLFVRNSGINSLAIDKTGRLIIAGDLIGGVHFIEIRKWVKND